MNNEIYEELVQLRDDPEAFEAARQRILEEEFAKMDPERERRARQHQWRLDGELRRFKDPTARYNHMVTLFWEGFVEFQGAVHQLDTIARNWRKEDEPSDEQG